MRDVRHQMCDIVEELYRASLITGTGGNLSVRDPERLQTVWITPSGMFKGALTPEMMVRIDLRGVPVDTERGVPSSERKIHAAIFEARPDVMAVVHCHAPKATILVNAGLPFLPISTESAFLTKLGRIPFVMPGTDALATAIVAALADGHGVLMQNHGLIVAASSLRRASDYTQIIEHTSEILIGCYMLGRTPPVLPEDLVNELAQKPDLMA
jgi:ribulose-5-phosphate 4-epimerase/fuculose-1-phosphate aldolase